MLGVTGLRKSCRRIVGRMLPGAGILLYHRVSEIHRDPQLLCVTPAHFVEQLEVLRRWYVVRSLEQLLNAQDSGLTLRRQIAVTFDDGYLDNLTNAKPLLAKHDVPAVVFVAVGHVGKTREFWWDELERIVLDPPHLPPGLVLEFTGTVHRWYLGTEEYDRLGSYRSWTVLDARNPTPRHKLYRHLCELLRPLGETERQGILSTLRFWAGVTDEGRSSHRICSPDDLIELSRD